MAHLQWVLGADGDDLVFIVAELARPGPSLADPLDETGVVGTAHRATAPTRAQQLPLETPASVLSTSTPPRPSTNHRLLAIVNLCRDEMGVSTNTNINTITKTNNTKTVLGSRQSILLLGARSWEDTGIIYQASQETLSAHGPYRETFSIGFI